MTSSTANWRRVSRKYPCGVCGYDSWCSVTTDGGTARCMRVSEGARRTDGKGGHIHVLRPGQRPSGIREVHLPKPAPDWGGLVKVRQAETTDEQLEGLANMWGLPRIEPLRRLGCCWSSMWDCWLIPMRRHDGVVVGVHRRWFYGGRAHVKGSRLGLFMPVPISNDDPLFLPEGPSDVAALLTLGLAAAGRPDATNGRQDCCKVGRRRSVVVLGENDRKENGRWPGREGAEPLVQVLALHAREVRLMFPPAEFKDIRDWVHAGATRNDVLAAVSSAPPVRLQVGGRDQP